MKIQIKGTKRELGTPWHQDFRNPESLPDIKVIRTQFFLNFVAVLLPMVVAIFWVQKEMAISVLKGDIEKLESQKTSMKADNAKLVGYSRDFMKESAKLDVLGDYYYNLFSVSEMIAGISEKVPEEITLSSVRIEKGTRVVGKEVHDIWESQIVGFISQESQDAINVVNSFVEELEKVDVFAPYLEQAFLDSLNRDQATDTLNFIVSLTYSEQGVEEKEVVQ